MFRRGIKWLEFKDVQGITVEEVRKDDARALKMPGLAFHSALVVDGMEKVTEGNRLRGRVFLGVARLGKSGRFEFVVNVPDGVREVVIGDERHVVWSAPSP